MERDPFDPLAVLQRVRAELGKSGAKAAVEDGRGSRGPSRGPEQNGRPRTGPDGGEAEARTWLAPVLKDGANNNDDDGEREGGAEGDAFSHRLEKLPDELVERPVGPATLLSIAELQMQLAHAHARLANQEVRIADMHEENRTLQTKLHTHLSERSQWRIERRELESALRETRAQVRDLLVVVKRNKQASGPQPASVASMSSSQLGAPPSSSRSRSPSPTRSQAPSVHSHHHQRRRPSTGGSGSRRRVSAHSAMTSPLDWASPEINTLQTDSFAPSSRPRRRSGFAAMASSVRHPNVRMHTASGPPSSDKSSETGFAAASHGSDRFSQASRTLTADHFTAETFSDHFRDPPMSPSSTPSLSNTPGAPIPVRAPTEDDKLEARRGSAASGPAAPPPPHPTPSPQLSSSLAPSHGEVSTVTTSSSSRAPPSLPITVEDVRVSGPDPRLREAARDASSEPSFRQQPVKRPFIGTVRRGSLFRDSVFHVENDHSAAQRQEAAQLRDREQQRHSRANSLSSFASAGTWHRRGIENGNVADPPPLEPSLSAFKEESASVENGARNRPPTGETRSSRRSSRGSSARSSVRTSINL